MKRVVYLCLDTIADEKGKRPHTHVYEIIKGLKKRGWKVRLYHPSYSPANSPSLVKKLGKFVSLQAKLWFTEDKADILYIRNHVAAFPTVLWAKIRGIPVVWEVNGPYDDLFIAWPWTRRVRPLFVWLLRKAMQWSRVVIAVTPQLATWAAEEGAREVRVIPNGANTEMFKPGVNPPEGIKLPRNYVLFFGSFAPWQGIDVMLEAVKSPSWPPDVHLIMVGDGVERPKVEIASSALKRIIYLGPQPYRNMPGLIAHAIAALSPKKDLKVYSSSGLAPLKVFETLACGVPVIVSDLPYMADLVREGECGIVVPPDDAEAIARAVRYLYEHPEERAEMGRRGRKLVETQHSWDKRAEATAQVLQKAVSERKQASVDT